MKFRRLTAELVTEDIPSTIEYYTKFLGLELDSVYPKDIPIPQCKGKGYRPLVAQLTGPNIVFVTKETSRETSKLITTQSTWKKDRRFAVSRILKEEKDRAQLSFPEGEEYDYLFFVTNTELSSEDVIGF